MASQPEGCGGVPLIATTPVQLARSARMEEKTKERERLTAILKELDDKNDLLQPVYQKVKRLPCTAHANTHARTGEGRIAHAEHGWATVIGGCGVFRCESGRVLINRSGVSCDRQRKIAMDRNVLLSLLVWRFICFVPACCLSPARPERPEACSVHSLWPMRFFDLRQKPPTTENSYKSRHRKARPSCVHARTRLLLCFQHLLQCWLEWRGRGPLLGARLALSVICALPRPCSCQGSNKTRWGPFRAWRLRTSRVQRAQVLRFCQGRDTVERSAGGYICVQRRGLSCVISVGHSR